MGYIGVFDSGYGGLTVLRELRKNLPQYDYIYLGDNARAPYGNRSFETVYQYTLQAVEKLFDMGAYLVLLACNTASAKALRTIQRHDLPRLNPNKRVLGVIRPSVEQLHSYSKSAHVGILATTGTVNSQSYLLEIQKLHPHIHVSQLACPMWVPLVENDEYNTAGADFFVQRDLQQILQNPKIDTLVLACTHYPLLEHKIRTYLPPGVQLVSQGSIVAESLKNYLSRHPEIDINCTRGGSCRFYTTETEALFKQMGQKFLGESFTATRIVLH